MTNLSRLDEYMVDSYNNRPEVKLGLPESKSDISTIGIRNILITDLVRRS